MPRIDELWYDLELRSKEFTEGLKESEAAGRRFTKFMVDHPLAVTAGLAAGLVALGAKATAMAAEVDGAVRKIGASLPDAVDKTDKLKQAIAELSKQSGISQVELAERMKEVAAGGVENTEALIRQTRAAVTAAQASGTDLSQVIDGLDASLDVFGLTANDADRVLGRLFATAQNKAPITDLFGALQRLAPVVHDTGISFNEATAAMGYLFSKGYNTRNAVAELGQVAKEKGAAGIRELADKATIATNGLEQMEKQAERVRGSLQNSAAVLRERYNAALIELGNVILPHVVEVTEGWVQILDGTTKRLAAQQDLFNVTQLGAYADRLKAGSVAWTNLWNSARATIENINNGTANLSSMSVTQLQALATGLGNFLKSQGKNITEEMRQQADMAFKAIGGALSDALNRQNAPKPADKLGTGGAGSGGKTTVDEAAEKAAEVLRQFKEKVQDTFDQATVTLIDDTAHAIERFQAEAKKAGLSAGETAAAVELLQKQLEALAPTEEADTFLAGIDDSLVHAEGLQHQLNEIQRIMGNLEVVGNRLPAGSEKRRQIEERIQKLQQLQVETQNKLTGAVTKTDAAATTTEEHIASWQEKLGATLHTVSEIARGGIGIANAFGLADDKASTLLNSVATIADSLPGALSGNLSSIFAVVGSVTQLLGGLFGGGPSADELEDRRIRKENNQSLRELTKQLGEFNKQITGLQYAEAQRITQTLLGSPGGYTRLGPKGVQYLDEDKLKRTLVAQGTSLSELKELAKLFGITLNTSSLKDFTESLKKLDEAIKQTELTRFVETFAGRMEALNARLKIFGITDPLKQLEETVKELSKGPRLTPNGVVDTSSPAFRQILKGLDINNEADRQSLLQRIQDLFNQFDAGTLSPDQLGGLTPEEFINQLGSLADLIRQISGQGGASGTTQNAGVNRSITDTTALRQVSLLISMDDSLQLIANAVVAMAQAQGLTIPGGGPGSGGGGLDAIPFTGPIAYSQAGGGTGVWIDSLAITVAAAPGADPYATGQGVADGMVDVLERKFGVRIREKRRATGGLEL